MYTVKAVGELLGLSPHTIRYYTDMNLIPNLMRDKNNNRTFDEAAINWLIGIKNLRGCGMSIDAIRHYIDLCLLGDATIVERHKIISNQKAIVDTKLKEVTEHASYMAKKVQHYKEIIDKVIPDDTNPAKWSTNKKAIV